MRGKMGGPRQDLLQHVNSIAELTSGSDQELQSWYGLWPRASSKSKHSLSSSFQTLKVLRSLIYFSCRRTSQIARRMSRTLWVRVRLSLSEFVQCFQMWCPQKPTMCTFIRHVQGITPTKLTYYERGVSTQITNIFSLNIQSFFWVCWKDPEADAKLVAEQPAPEAPKAGCILTKSSLPSPSNLKVCWSNRLTWWTLWLRRCLRNPRWALSSLVEASSKLDSMFVDATCFFMLDISGNEFQHEEQDFAYPNCSCSKTVHT